MKNTLEQIINKEKEHRSENGTFGIKACKELIKSEIAFSDMYNRGETLFTLLEKYYNRTDDPFFNKAMVLSCWELINEQ